ncbi:hypothetical protein TanjilG_00580 [Lupinus angustifolius]|uniref:Uncharacterized protein n=1 Tax=Lupinus angustifolius TaxID=3871 RepID=A0A394DA44_LUPAN|nr:hypothetical protein TanjilG_00580 [Lupinus angustifolius]
MPNGHMEQGVGSFVQPSPGSMQVVDERNDVHNQLLDVPNLEGQSSILCQNITRPSNLSGLQVMGSRIVGLSGNASLVQMPESSHLLRQERASNIQLQRVAHASGNRPTIWKNWKGKNGEEYVPPGRGRPRKRFEVGESSNCPKYQMIEKDSSGRENAGTSPIQQEANNASENVTNEVQNANPSNPSPYAQTPREITNCLYGLAFERNCVPTDPHLRLFKGPPGNYNYFLGMILFLLWLVIMQQIKYY